MSGSSRKVSPRFHLSERTRGHQKSEQYLACRKDEIWFAQAQPSEHVNLDVVSPQGTVRVSAMVP